MRRWILALALLAGLAHAGDNRPALVEIANFDCPYCREIDEHHPRIGRAAKQAGLRFIYAPIPNDGDAENAWRERAYYAARDLPVSLSQIRTALLATQDATTAITTLDALVAWLDMQVPEVLWGDFAQDHVRQAKSRQAVERALELAAKGNVERYPTFLLVDHHGVDQIDLTGSVAEQTDALIDHLKRLRDETN